ncbi:metal-dependent hydrolase family protein [Fodinicola acaciae]|uniref:metal-dependent hydrolase family protein n=1 Tax=Fodinicola acaciae TaxID=2681555 RepID=UPI0013D785B2|nr:amidohydrolase family protein [Fodinicola acaciae]
MTGPDQRFVARRMIDETGRVVPYAYICVTDGVISDMDSGKFTGSLKDVIDLGDCTLMPGMIDAHVHLSGRRSYEMSDRVIVSRDVRVLRAADDLRALLRAGFTTVRDVGSDIALSLTRAIRDGLIEGPDVLAAGPIIGQTGGHSDHRYLPLEQARQFEGAMLADGIDECRRAVRIAVRAGADLIKFCTTGGVGSEGDHPSDSHYTISEATALVEEAHRLGRRVATHAQGAKGIMTALVANVDTIEHGTYLDDASATLFLKTGAILVPTVALRDIFVQTQKDFVNVPTWRRRKQSEAIDAIEAGFQLARRCQIPLACGSDYTGVPPRVHGQNADEPIAMVKMGLAPADAVQALTLGGANALGIADEVGTLTIGKRANMIAVQGNPHENIHVLKSIRAVVKDGRVVG